VYLSGEPLYEEPLLLTIRHLAVPLLDIRVPEPAQEDLDMGFFHTMQRLHLFKGLKSLTFIVHDGPCCHCSEQEFPQTEMMVPKNLRSVPKLQFDEKALEKLDVPKLPVQVAKARHPEWRVPKVAVRVLTRGGEICCGFGRED
jgi:hypothetical protein